ncbi:hypothetical protein SAMN05421788_101836 [Filimonas lacunae]|uniref:Uncharacterized protein n=1 Tax=Filimonas lacunae TaxID=477680 RepID=A0A173MPP4_9BACT|nr:hypothetical protein [Filimonas lacunae]BAV09400.1 hypothetical protein FLA_5448 [Filimonas lacunae]SIS72455.1 hypothetical protein SAMN05421788_101836 [Filimonas lacunae]
MPLNATLLGQQLYNKASEFNNVNIDDIEQARKDFWNGIASEVVAHIQANAALNVPGLGLIAGPYPVTGNSITGKIQ